MDPGPVRSVRVIGDEGEALSPRRCAAPGERRGHVCSLPRGFDGGRGPVLEGRGGEGGRHYCLVRAGERESRDQDQEVIRGRAAPGPIIQKRQTRGSTAPRG